MDNNNSDSDGSLKLLIRLIKDCDFLRAINLIRDAISSMAPISVLMKMLDVTANIDDIELTRAELAFTIYKRSSSSIVF